MLLTAGRLVHEQQGGLGCQLNANVDALPLASTALCASVVEVGCDWHEAGRSTRLHVFAGPALQPARLCKQWFKEVVLNASNSSRESAAAAAAGGQQQQGVSSSSSSHVIVGAQQTKATAGAPDASLLHHAHHLVLHVAQLRVGAGEQGSAQVGVPAAAGP